MFKILDFRPFPGLASPHAQTFMASYGPSGKEPPSQVALFQLSDGDVLSCQISTPIMWQPSNPTIALVHGMGGSHGSTYMVRLARKFYQAGYRVVRINLRGCGSGVGLNRLPYNSGNSHDVWTVMEKLNADYPNSPITLIGFSLGGNIILKMAGEQSKKAGLYVKRLIAICPVLDIHQSINVLLDRSQWLYHRYYLNRIQMQGQRWLKDLSIPTIKSYDEQVTAPLWGYLDANDYYDKCSSFKYIDNITIPCDILLAADDPFIDHQVLEQIRIQSLTNVWLTSFGGHLGFIGRPVKDHGIFWLDHLLLSWI